MNKRGLSAVLTNIILISLCVIAAGAVGVIIKNSFEEGVDEISIDQITLDLEISRVQVLNDTDIAITLKRNVGGGDLSGVAFVMYDKNSSEVIQMNISMEELEVRNYSIILHVINASLLDKISIAPIFKKRFGKDKLGTIIDDAPIVFGRVTSGGGGGGSSSNSDSDDGGDAGGEEDPSNETEENQNDEEEEIPEYNLLNETECGVCDHGFTCNEGVCEFSGNNLYYVAINGNDSKSGTISEPWRTLQNAIVMAEPGDVIYIRGGIYNMDHTIEGDPELGKGSSGTQDNPIRFLNYPGERPIFDWNSYMPLENRWTNSISFSNVEYIHFRGFTIRNVRQQPPDFTINDSEQYAWAMGFGCVRCANIIYENLAVHDIDGRAFQHWTGAWSDFDADYALELCLADPNETDCAYKIPKFEHDVTKWINCDAYNLYDLNSESPGNHADGWKVGTTYGNEFHWINSRAWNYSDDGFDPHGAGTRIFDGTLAMSTLTFRDAGGGWDAELNGYKMTGVNPNVAPDYVPGETPLIYMKNSLAIDCGWTGFYNNIGVEHGAITNGGAFYNNFAFHNEIGYSDYSDGRYYNNIVYDSQGTETCGGPYDLAMHGITYVESNNTWMLAPEVCKWWENNPAFNVADNDFVSLDTSLLIQPRNDDFTLPHTDFGKLQSNSELIDNGTIIGGYHCGTPGRHTDSGCREWTGSAPDLGPYEYGLEPEVECIGPTARPCISGEGVGQQIRNCIGPGDWSSWSNCEFVGCDPGYEMVEGECIVGSGWSRELLLNGGFENDVVGWTTSSSDWQSAPYSEHGDTRTPHTGYYVATIDPVSSYDDFIYQDVDLNDYVVRIDQGRGLINASGWANKPAIFGSSNRIQYFFLDEDKSVISTVYDSGYSSEGEWWQAALFEEPVPIGTRYFRVWANTYNSGVRSGDLDSFSVKVNVLP